MKPLCLCFALLCATLLSACGGSDASGMYEYSYSFESGLEGWSAKAMDIIVGGAEIEWSIETSAERATLGGQSAKFYADNMTDACKIWLEKGFELPAGTYHVELNFDFASDDFGGVNNWTVIAGATTLPVTATDALPFRDSTANGSDSNVGYLWLDKVYTGRNADSATLVVAEGQTAYVQLGVWGTWETPRTFYVDNLRVTFTPVAQP